MTVLLDTHMWIWWLTSSSSIRQVEREALDATAQASGVCLSAISMWEAQLLHSRQRLVLPLPFAEWVTRATDSQVLSVLPIDREVIIALESLPASFHGDPADRLIVATARAYGLPLATRDSSIRKSRAAKLWKP